MCKVNLRTAVKSTWFRKFALSMICVTFLPMIVIMVFYYQHVNLQIKDEMLQVFSTKAANVQDRQNTIWNSISNITVSLNNHPEVLEYIRSPYAPLRANDVRIILSNLVAAHPAIDEIFLFRPSDQSPVISSRYVFDVSHINTAPKLNGQSVFTAFNSLDNNEIVSATYLDLNYGQNPEPYQVLLYRINGFYNTVNPYQYCIVYAIRTDVLLEYSDLFTSDNQGLRGIAMIGRNGKVLGISGQNQERLSSLLAGYTLPGEQGNQTLETDFGRYEMLWPEDQFNQFRTVLLLPTAESVGSINQELARMIILFFALAIITLLLFIYLLTINYSPIRNLEDDCASIMEDLKVFHRVDGKTPFESIDATLQGLKNQIVNLKSVISNNQDSVRNDLLLSLLNGNSCQQDMEQALLDNGVSFHQAGFTMFYITFDDRHVSVVERKASMMRFFGRRQFQCYTASSLGNWFILLVNHLPAESGNLAACINDYQNLITEQNNDSMVIGMASEVCSIRDLPTLYAKAKLAHEYHFLLGSSLINYADIEQHLGSTMPHPLYMRQREELAQSIRAGNLEQVTVRLQRLNDSLCHSSSGMLETRHLCYDLIFFVVQLLNERVGESKYSVNFEELLQIHTVDHLFERIHTLCASEMRRRDKAEKQYPSVETINAYIAEHYHDQLFSISYLAEQYEMSGSAFSQYYKKKSGSTISDFLMSCRIEQAIRLLLSTDLQVSQIVNEIGYYSASSFIKKFKSYTGMTPGEYRASHKGG